MRSDGLIVRAGTSAIDPRNALRVARKCVRESLPGEWIVKPMGAESRDFTVRRRRSSDNPTVARAFEMARGLRRHRDVEDCEPSLLMPVDGPREMQVRTGRRKGIATRRLSGLNSSSSGSGSHLSCSAAADWAHSLCSIRKAWELVPPGGGKLKGEGIVIGHPDTGYTDHPEIADPARLLKLRGYDFEDEDRDARDPLTGRSAGHGTSTGSVIMSSDSTAVGVIGVAPQASLIPLRVTGNVVILSFGKLASAIRYAVDSGVHVISISLGGPVSSRFLDRAVHYAVERGVIVVCAAGNVWPFVVYPARLDEAIAVAACNCQGKVWADSASGSAVDITAPGESVWRAESKSGSFVVSQSSGTSYATAVVAGAAALWLAYHGRDRLVSKYGVQNLASVFREQLIRHGFDRPLRWDTEQFGVGILNAEKLLKAPLPASAMASGLRSLRSTAAPTRRSSVDQIADLFPEATPVAIRKGLSKFLGVSDIHLNREIDDVADEIAYHAATNMRFRELVLAGKISASVAAGSSGTSRALAAGRTSRRSASRTASMAPAVSKQLKAMTGTLK